MPETLPVADPGADDGGLDILGQVTLVSFEATPLEIGPFGASKLTWGVEGPDGFFVELDGRRVGRTGEMIVTPQRDTTYVLRARAGRFVDVLGKRTVTVDLATCRTFLMQNIDETIEGAIRGAIDADPDLYFRPRPPAVGQPGPATPGPVLNIRPGSIAFTMALGVVVNNSPNPSVDVKASFGLTVVNGTIVATNQKVSAKVKVPWYAWLVPGAVIALPLAIENGEETARARIQQAIDRIAQLLDFLASPGANRRLHSVQILVEGSFADLQVVHCPDALLLGLIPQEVAPIR